VLEGILIFAVSMVAIGVVAARRGHIAIPVSPVAEAADATLVRIAGEVSSAKPLRAPYSGRSCVYYKLELTYSQFNRRERFEHSDRCDFVVSDSTGSARVSCARAVFEAVPSDGETTRASLLSDRARAVIRELGWHAPDIAAAIVSETVVAIGDLVDIAGTSLREVRANEAVERGFRDEPSTQLVFSGDVYVRGGGAPKLDRGKRA
jgi:hypothetical protein